MDDNMNRKVEEFRLELVEILRQNGDDRNSILSKLEEFGIDDKKMVEDLLSAFGYKKRAEEWVRGARHAWQNSTSGVDFANDIGKSEAELESCDARFDYIVSRLSLIRLTHEIDMSQVDKKFLDNLSEQDIKEEDIKNPGLKLTYGYFLKNKQNQEKLAEMDSEVSTLRASNAWLTQEKEELTGRLDRLSKAYIKLQELFKERIAVCEKQYQSALAVIGSLRGKLSDLQNRGFFQFIKYKFMRQEALPRGENEQIPDTLYKKGERLAPDTLPGPTIETILRTPEETRGLAKPRGNDLNEGWLEEVMFE